MSMIWDPEPGTYPDSTAQYLLILCLSCKAQSKLLLCIRFFLTNKGMLKIAILNSCLINGITRGRFKVPKKMSLVLDAEQSVSSS